VVRVRDNPGVQVISDPTAAAQLNRLAGHLERHRRWFVLTGAGVSTGSGIPDYRDAAGDWKRRPPITIQAFRAEAGARARYWARSLIGWPRIDAARPNPAHHGLADLGAGGRFTALATQNVDGLHQRAAAGAHTAPAPIIDLHGRLEQVVCLDCSARQPRVAMQAALRERNPSWAARADALAAASPAGPKPATAPDGDVDLDGENFDAFRVPDCPHCGGLLKPDVVFFGESVPRERVERAFAALGDADAMLVAGTSLMVYSGFRFAREAAELGKPIVAINLGRTRADPLLADKIGLPCEEALAGVAALLRCVPPPGLPALRPGGLPPPRSG
jgi:NAD-dependent SIR2 family protein deacetylase